MLNVNFSKIRSEMENKGHFTFDGFMKNLTGKSHYCVSFLAGTYILFRVYGQASLHKTANYTTL